jgi:hypothetical protein
MKNNGLIAFMGIIIMAVMLMYPSVLAISYSDNTYGKVVTPTASPYTTINNTYINQTGLINDSYYLKSNPFGFYNVTTLPATDLSNYYNKSTSDSRFCFANGTNSQGLECGESLPYNNITYISPLNGSVYINELPIFNATINESYIFTGMNFNEVDGYADLIRNVNEYNQGLNNWSIFFLLSDGISIVNGSVQYFYYYSDIQSLADATPEHNVKSTWLEDIKDWILELAEDLFYTKSEVYNKSETYNQSEVNALLSSAGNSSFNQTLTDSLYFKVGQNINAPTINLTINNFNMTGEFRYDTNNVFGYTLPSRTLDVYKTEFGDGSIPSGSSNAAAGYTRATDSTTSSQFVDAFMTIAGQNTGLTTTNNIPAKNLRKFTLSVSVPIDAGHKTVVGCYSSSTSADINTVDTGVFYYEEDHGQWNAKCCESGSCTNININYSIPSGNQFVWLDIISNAPNTINGQATMFSFYVNNVYKGNCTSNLPIYYNRCGGWLENTNTYLDTILYDFAYIESTRVA